MWNLPDFRELVLHCQTSVRDKKTYLDIAGDEISRLRYVFNEKVKCKVPIWTDGNLIFPEIWFSAEISQNRLFIGPYRNLMISFEHFPSEFEAYILWFCSTHECYKTSKYELQTPSVTYNFRSFRNRQKNITVFLL